MATTKSLTTVEGLEAYLVSKGIEHTDVKLVSGGYTNFVYRVTRPDGTTVIYKHASSHSRTSTDFALDPARMDYEDRILEILPPLVSKHLPHFCVHAAKWYDYDKDAKLLCIADGGSSNLKDAYTDPKLDIKQIGEDIGKWIAAVHMCTTKTTLSLSNSEDLKANSAIGVHLCRHSYENLHVALKEYGHRTELAEYINNTFGSQLSMESDNECICHGDFWPGNMLINFPPSSSEYDITVVDWEITRRGISATDVGQFAAEAFLLDRFRGGRGLLPAFLNAYAGARKKGDIEKNWVRRMAVHWGVHIAYWPTRSYVFWADREGTQKLVDIAVGVLQAAVDGDWEALRRSELLKDVGDVYIGV
jgi:thiamine kinase-like enzyme